MKPGFRKDISKLFNRPVYIAKTDSLEPGNLCVPIRVKKGGFYIDPVICISKKDAAKWDIDPQVQANILHELGHLASIPLCRPGTSHFVKEIAASINGYFKFRKLATKVTFRQWLKHLRKHWHYYVDGFQDPYCIDHIVITSISMFAVWIALFLGLPPVNPGWKLVVWFAFLCYGWLNRPSWRRYKTNKHI